MFSIHPAHVFFDRHTGIVFDVFNVTLPDCLRGRIQSYFVSYLNKQTRQPMDVTEPSGKNVCKAFVVPGATVSMRCSPRQYW